LAIFFYAETCLLNMHFFRLQGTLFLPFSLYLVLVGVPTCFKTTTQFSDNDERCQQHLGFFGRLLFDQKEHRDGFFTLHC